jgi:hypothetical protein
MDWNKQKPYLDPAPFTDKLAIRRIVQDIVASGIEPRSCEFWNALKHRGIRVITMQIPNAWIDEALK